LQSIDIGTAQTRQDLDSIHSSRRHIMKRLALLGLVLLLTLGFSVNVYAQADTGTGTGTGTTYDDTRDDNDTDWGWLGLLGLAGLMGLKRREPVVHRDTRPANAPVR
jgi:MYXO-CTERM domain-containing protein